MQAKKFSAATSVATRVVDACHARLSDDPIGAAPTVLDGGAGDPLRSLAAVQTAQFSALAQLVVVRFCLLCGHSSAEISRFVLPKISTCLAVFFFNVFNNRYQFSK